MTKTMLQKCNKYSAQNPYHTCNSTITEFKKSTCKENINGTGTNSIVWQNCSLSTVKLPVSFYISFTNYSPTKLSNTLVIARYECPYWKVNEPRHIPLRYLLMSRVSSMQGTYRRVVPFFVLTHISDSVHKKSFITENKTLTIRTIQFQRRHCRCQCMTGAAT